MNLRIILILFSLSFASCAENKLRKRIKNFQLKRQLKKSMDSFELKINDSTRTYHIFKPRSRSEGRWPLVISLHGGMGNGIQHAEMTKMNQIATNEKFIVAFPNGTGRFKNRFLTFNAGNCCGYAKRKDIDDIKFLKNVIDDITNRYPIDSKRIYMTGFSNGAMLTYKFAQHHPELLAGIAPVSGDQSLLTPLPKSGVPILHVHGLKDQNVLFAGGKGEDQIDPNPHRSIMEGISFWQKINKTKIKPDIKVTQDYIQETYSPRAAEGYPVILVKIPKGGHTWPGGNPPRKFAKKNHIKSFNASEYIWKFFSQLKK